MNDYKQKPMSSMKISKITKEKLEQYKDREGCKTLSDAVNLLLKVDELSQDKKKPS